MPVLLLTGVGTAAALAAVTFATVVHQALEFGPDGDLPAGELTV